MMVVVSLLKRPHNNDASQEIQPVRNRGDQLHIWQRAIEGSDSTIDIQTNSLAISSDGTVLAIGSKDSKEEISSRSLNSL